jgi:hypothetical protein
MKFTPALFRQRISEVLLAAHAAEPEARRGRGLPPGLRRHSGEPGESETYSGVGIEALSRRIETLSQRLDLFAVESTRLQNQNESLAQAAMARMGQLIRQLGPAPAAKGSEETILIAEIDGCQVGVPGREWKLAWHYLLRGGLEPGIERIFRRLVKPGMVVVDAGAGVGAHTVLAAVLMGGRGAVIGLEPDPKAYAILRWNLERNGLTSSRGVWHGAESVASLDPARIPGTDAAHPRVDLMRIAAEQVSPALVGQLSRIFSRNPQIEIILEYCCFLTGTAISAKQILEQLLSAGFSVQKIDAESGVLSPLDANEFASAFSTNLRVRRML